MTSRGRGFIHCQCDQISRNFTALATYWEIFGHILKVYFVFGKVGNTLWVNLYDLGQIFIVVNGQILKNQFGHLVTLARRNDEKLGSELSSRQPGVTCTLLTNIFCLSRVWESVSSGPRSKTLESSNKKGPTKNWDN